MLKGRHVIQPDDLSVAEIEEICALAEQIIVDPNSFKDVCRGKILAALFFARGFAGFRLSAPFLRNSPFRAAPTIPNAMITL